MTKTHEIKLDGYGAHTTLAEDRPIMLLGTAESYGIETLHVVSGKSWEGLTVTATFNAPDGTSTDMLMSADGSITVPPEATSKSGSGRIVFAGVSNGVQRISCDLEYFVVAHSAINGVQSGGTAPSWFEQAATRFVPTGGTAGQVLTKKTDADFDAEWQDSKGGAGLEPLVGTNKTLTPWQVREAFLQGQPIVFSFIDASGEVGPIFQSFEIFDDIIVASAIIPLIGSQDMGVGVLTGYLSSNVWEFSETVITNPDDIQKAINTALAAAKASGEFDGADGKSAYQYAQDGGYTGTEAEFAAKLAAEKFANPYPLTFTGAVSGSYDGSSAKTIEIPSGGGGAHSDWNQNDSTAADYIKNRPFYMGDPVETVLVEESTVSFVEQGGIYAAEFQSTFVPTVGETYKVSWDGTVYECTCVNFGEAIVIGNLSIVGAGSDSGEPFLMNTMNGAGIVIGTLDTSASHTFSISGFVVEVVKIDEKYLPDVLTTKMNNTNPTGSGSFSLNRKADTPIGANSFAEGWKTTASGERSHAEGSETTASGRRSHAEGNVTTASGSYSHAEGYATIASGEGSHAEGYSTIASSNCQHVQGQYNIEDSSNTYANIVGNGSPGSRSNAYTLDWKGNAWYSGTIEGKALILPSSTAGSTKKFKITVDDSGTITATEVV